MWLHFGHLIATARGSHPMPGSSFVRERAARRPGAGFRRRANQPRLTQAHWLSEVRGLLSNVGTTGVGRKPLTAFDLAKVVWRYAGLAAKIQIQIGDPPRAIARPSSSEYFACSRIIFCWLTLRLQIDALANVPQASHIAVDPGGYPLTWTCRRRKSRTSEECQVSPYYASRLR